MRKVFYSLGLGLAGGAVGNFFDIPLGWLLGAIVANMVASMHNVPVAIPRPLRLVALSVLGVVLGSAFAPQLLARAPAWGLSLIVLVAFLAVAVPWAYYYGRRITGLDKPTAMFASIPGGLAEMVMLGWSMGADPRTTTLAQSARLLTIVVVVPLLMRVLTDAEFDTTTGTDAGPAGSLRSVDVLILVAGAIAGGFTARLVHAPAPFMIGPMFVTAAVYVSAVIETRPPVELTILIQVVLGSGIGSRFAGATLYELFRTFGLSIGLTFSLLVLVVVFAYGVSGVTAFEFAALVLAYTPGGIAEMGILALLLDVDPVFVSTHQTFRVMLIYLLVPILARRWLK